MDRLDFLNRLLNGRGLLCRRVLRRVHRADRRVEPVLELLAVLLLRFGALGSQQLIVPGAQRTHQPSELLP